MPLILKNSIPSGVSAGVMNGMCYVGSAIAVYLVGFVAENSGWKSVYLTISFITIGILVLASAGLLFHKFGTNNKAKNKQV